MKRLSKKETRRIVDELERLRAENENLRLRRDEAKRSLGKTLLDKTAFLLSDYALAADDLPPAEKPPAWRKKPARRFRRTGPGAFGAFRFSVPFWRW